MRTIGEWGGILLVGFLGSLIGFVWGLIEGYEMYKEDYNITEVGYEKTKRNKR